MKVIKPTPCTNSVIDVGRKCNINCKHCFYRFDGDKRKLNFETVEDLKILITKAKNRGCDYLVFSGGEPTLHPNLPELIDFGLKNEMKSCVITNGMCGENTLKKIVNAGIDDVLVSIHGSEGPHDTLTETGARKRQIRFLEQLKKYPDVNLRFNCTLTKFTETDMIDVANFAIKWEPNVFNVINFLPHYQWSLPENASDLKMILANLRKVQPILEEGIDLLESNNIGVNVRYYPMCRMREDLRRTICNDLHVTFDDKEWDYEIEPKTFEDHRKWGVMTSNGVEWKNYPCKACDLKNVCGGINKTYNCMTRGEYVEAVNEPDLIDKNDFYFYRQHNLLTLTKGVVDV